MADIIEGTIVESSDSKTLKQYFFHPTSIVVMTLLDWGGLLLEIPQTFAPFLFLFSSMGIFFISAFLTYRVQMQLSGDSKQDALKKAIFAGFICAIPYPIMSSSIGAIIIGLSGINALQVKGLGGLVSMFGKRRDTQVKNTQ